MSLQCPSSGVRLKGHARELSSSVSPRNPQARLIALIWQGGNWGKWKQSRHRPSAVWAPLPSTRLRLLTVHSVPRCLSGSGHPLSSSALVGRRYSALLQPRRKKVIEFDQGENDAKARGLLPLLPSGLPVRTLEWGLGRGQKQAHLPPAQNPNSEAEQRPMAERTPGTKIFEN